MDTPVCDFVRGYARGGALRLHMPGHKGAPLLGMEALDVTEIDGADSLYEASGVIKKSEENASALFGCPTFFSTEGSSQCIRAMCFLAMLHARQTGRRPVIAAGRNAHKTFLSAAALLNMDVAWLVPDRQESYLSCALSAGELNARLEAMEEKPAAVYLTSPDYLGNRADIGALAQVCHDHGALLLVDNAHGAYLRFLTPSLHPMDLGADLCCDSAHKTLPALTGAAYLHIAPQHGQLIARAKDALAMFGSTSPSYLILQSLDAVNAYLADGYKERLAAFTAQVKVLKEHLTAQGYALAGDEPLKITVRTKPYGYTGKAYAAALLSRNIVCEFADPDFVVLMLTPETEEAGLALLEREMLSIPKGAAIAAAPPVFHMPKQAMRIREAMLGMGETIPATESEGRVLASPGVGCPPAVPIVVCGEKIDKDALSCFAYYGIETCTVLI